MSGKCVFKVVRNFFLLIRYLKLLIYKKTLDILKFNTKKILCKNKFLEK